MGPKSFTAKVTPGSLAAYGKIISDIPYCLTCCVIFILLTQLTSVAAQ